jgi:hypothetical protein
MFEHAPSVDILGSFFPVWMVCIVAALVLTIAVRWLLVRVGLESELGLRVVIYPSLVALFACSIWLLVFRY